MAAWLKNCAFAIGDSLTNACESASGFRALPALLREAASVENWLAPLQLGRKMRCLHMQEDFEQASRGQCFGHTVQKMARTRAGGLERS